MASDQSSDRSALDVARSVAEASCAESERRVAAQCDELRAAIAAFGARVSEALAVVRSQSERLDAIERQQTEGARAIGEIGTQIAGVRAALNDVAIVGGDDDAE